MPARSFKKQKKNSSPPDEHLNHQIKRKGIPSLNPLITSRHRLLRYDGANFFRQRIILATIFNIPIQISNIRSENSNPGLRKYEACLLRLIDRITNGGTMTIDVTGTELKYFPGQLIGGDAITHDCGCERNITYFLEALLLLCPFAKTPLQIHLKGITHGAGCFGNDPSIDYFRTCAIPFMEKIRISDGLLLKLLKRGLPPLGKGEVEFCCPIIQKVVPFQLLEEGRVKRVRGTAFTNHVSPQFAVRMIDKTRALLNDFLPDVWIYDAKSKEGIDGPSSGYGIALVAETIRGFHKGADITVDRDMQHKLNQLRNPDAINDIDLLLQRKMKITEILSHEEKRVAKRTQTISSINVEDESETCSSASSLSLGESELVGRLAARRLLLEIHYGGVIDTTFQHIPLLFMALAEEHQSSKIKLSKLTPYTVQFLRHLKDFCGVEFLFEEVTLPEAPNDVNSPIRNDMYNDYGNSESKGSDIAKIPQYIVQCVGIGFRNLGRKTF